MSPGLDALVAEATSVLEEVKRRASRPLVAFSGGKDGLVVAHLAARLGIVEAICEVSYTFQAQVDCAVRHGEAMGLDLTLSEILPYPGWLAQHPEHAFNKDRRLVDRRMEIRQRRAVKRHAKANGHDCCIFGRRTEENNVRALIYETKAGLQAHPIRNWRERHVWEYIDAQPELWRPWIYGTRFGEVAGNAPFYALPQKTFGTKRACWDYVAGLDPRFTPEAFGIEVED